MAADEIAYMQYQGTHFGVDVYQWTRTDPYDNPSVIRCTHPDHLTSKYPRLYILGHQRIERDARELFPATVAGLIRLLIRSQTTHLKYFFWKRIAGPLRMVRKTWTPGHFLRLKDLRLPATGTNPWAHQPTTQQTSEGRA